MELHRAIVIRRTMLDMSRGDLVAASGLSYPFVAELEKGTKEPSMRTLRALADGLRFDGVTAMFEWADRLAVFMGDEGAHVAGADRVVDITPLCLSFT
jgi:predicted transcriptional regulator